MKLEFPDSLPVCGRREEIAQAILKHSVIIVCGETGSGKTTQLPKIAISLGRGQKGKTIAHTQPRRIAAMTVARRIAQELEAECGSGPNAQVGFQVRFNDRSRPGIPLKLMTDGVLLAQTQNDPMLSAYDTIIVDEAHERSLNIDFLLGYLKNLIEKRKDLKVIITSATIDAVKFAQHFAVRGVQAPVIEVSGRLFPVETRYRPAASTDQDLIESVVAGIEECEADWSGQGPGDILVFLPGEREIRAVSDELQARSSQSLAARSGRTVREILPLYARLSQADQERVFRSSGARRAILATNVAETSLTVPGIRYVVDSGLARVKRYRYRGKVEQLQIEPIARAQADQRAGRCGRVADGVCIRLYAEDEFLQRPAFPDPEIHRTSLAAVMLRMKALGLPDIRQFPFIDPPSGKAVADGLLMLKELNAIDGQGALTETGQQIARLPVDPKIGRMLVSAHQRGALKEVLIIAAALSVQDARERPTDRSSAADQSHAKFSDPKSEFLSLLKIWKHTQALFDERASQRKYEQALRAAFLSPLRVREWREVHQQLTEWVDELGWKQNEQDAGYEALHEAILSGLLSNTGCRLPDEPLWQGTHDVKFLIWPGSYLAKKPPRWLMAAEQVETSRLFARTIAAIEPEWIERVASHLLKKSHAEPHWEKKSGRVLGYERASLYGLTVYQRRKVAWAGLGPSHQAEARAIFIREALVAEDWVSPLHFFSHNAQQIQAVRALEDRSRRPDILVDDELLFAFYDQSLPDDVFDAQSLSAWYGREVRRNASLLCLTKNELMRHEAAGITTEQFPKQIQMNQLTFAVDYCFSPGDRRDGLTLIVPEAQVHAVDQVACDWLVPGMLKEKVLHLLKSLPQRIRRHCVPLPDYAAQFCVRQDRSQPTLADRRTRLIQALIQDISEQTGMTVRRDDFRFDGMPAHCWMNFRLVDAHGRQLAEGRDLERLCQDLGLIQQDPVAQSQTADQDALRDRFAASVRESIKSLDKELNAKREMVLGLMSLLSPEELSRQLRDAVISQAFMEAPLPQTDAAFEARLAQGRTRVVLLGQELLRWLCELASAYSGVKKKLLTVKSFGAPYAEIGQQLDRMLGKDVICATPVDRRMHLVRYLKAISLRIDKLRTDPGRDARWTKEIASVELPFWRWVHQHQTPWPQRVSDFRWLLEELRVSLYAQELKTPMPISTKRLQKVWLELKEL